jgi:biotin carboxyl carrier protein
MKRYKITINGNDYDVQINSLEGDKASVAVNGVEYIADIESVTLASEVFEAASLQSVHPASPAKSAASASAPVQASAPIPSSASISKGGSIKSPLPGVILEVFVSEGDVVKKGQKVMTLEAMKMENNIESDMEGTVAEIVKGSGDSVYEGDILIMLD